MCTHKYVDITVILIVIIIRIAVIIIIIITVLITSLLLLTLVTIHPYVTFVICIQDLLQIQLVYDVHQ